MDAGNSPVVRTNPEFRSLFRETMSELWNDRWYIEKRLKESNSCPPHSKGLEEEKSEILAMVKRDIASKLSENPDLKDAFNHDTMRGIRLFKRVCETKFQINIKHPEIEADLIVAGHVADPYGQPRDFEMLHDFLTGYMNYEEAVQLCNFAASFFI